MGGSPAAPGPTPGRWAPRPGLPWPRHTSERPRPGPASLGHVTPRSGPAPAPRSPSLARPHSRGPWACRPLCRGKGAPGGLGLARDAAGAGGREEAWGWGGPGAWSPAVPTECRAGLWSRGPGQPGSSGCEERRPGSPERRPLPGGGPGGGGWWRALGRQVGEGGPPSGMRFRGCSGPAHRARAQAPLGSQGDPSSWCPGCPGHSPRLLEGPCPAGGLVSTSVESGDQADGPQGPAHTGLCACKSQGSAGRGPQA